MGLELVGNIRGLAPSETKLLLKLYQRRFDRREIIPFDNAKELCELADQLGRRLGVLVSREGRVEHVIVGTRELLYLPNLGRARAGEGRLRKLRLVFTDISRSENVTIPSDIYADLEKLRLDLVVAIKPRGREIQMSYAYLSPDRLGGAAGSVTESATDIGTYQRDFDFLAFIESVEEQLLRSPERLAAPESSGAVLVGVYEKGSGDAESSIVELRELARTAGLKIIDTIIQKRDLDPRTLLGKGKLQELMLRCLRSGAGMIVFDAELRPSQWRAITNATELRVIDRSMLILDIFAQRATTSDGRLQVELAQLRYNLPKLVEKDAGLSRLSGGIGGRGPGETKLELGRRRIRDRIAELEQRINKLAEQRTLRRQKRVDQEIPLVALVGYTNVGKSSLFNVLTKSTVLAENKLFATLSPAQRRIVFPVPAPFDQRFAVLSDTVGFIRDLPKELFNAFRATLEELHGAALLLHVVDASDPEIAQKLGNVEAILTELELSSIPRVTVLNKIDACPPDRVALLLKEHNAVGVSAVKRTGIDDLRMLVYRAIWEEGAASTLIDAPRA